MPANQTTTMLNMETKYNVKNVIEDFLKNEYQEGLRNEFNTMEALINKLSKDTISGKKKYKTFALGVTDNIRAVGNNTDRYQLGLTDIRSSHGVDTVDAEFDTTKIMATFGITDEAILKGTGDGSFIDVFKDELDRMEVGQRHTMQRYTYGAPNGRIGKITWLSDVSASYANGAAGDITSTKPNAEVEFYKNSWNKYFPAGTKVFKVKLENSYSMLPGMGMILRNSTGGAVGNGVYTYVGYIWQKDNSEIGKEYLLFVVEKIYNDATEVTSTTTPSFANTTITVGSGATANIPTADYYAYSRQLADNGATVSEYTGLGAILEDMETYATVFGLNRNLYPQLKSPSMNLNNNYFLSEEIIRDMADHLAISQPDGTAINLVVSNYRLISQMEKNLYQLKEYNNYVAGSNANYGGELSIKFDNYQLMKDKFARGNHVYFLDTGKIGELVRRDWTWITSGEVNGVLQRRDGTEMYEGIMNKYADMYVEQFKCHAIIKNCKTVDSYASTFGQTFSKKVSIDGTVNTNVTNEYIPNTDPTPAP